MDFTSIKSFKEGDEKTLEMQLWENVAEAGVLMAPGWFFSAAETLDVGAGHFRISFSSAEVSFSTYARNFRADLYFSSRL